MARAAAARRLGRAVSNVNPGRRQIRSGGMTYNARMQRAQRTAASQRRAARPARTAKINQIRRASATGRPQPGMNPRRTPHSLGGNGANTAKKMTDFRKGLAFGTLGGAATMGVMSNRTGRATDRTGYSQSRGVYGY